MVSVLFLMDAVYELEQMSFPDFLRHCLEEHHRNIVEFYDFLFERDEKIDCLSNFYRFFSANPSVYRKPNEEFIEAFAEFLEFSPQQKTVLKLMWAKKRREHLR